MSDNNTLELWKCAMCDCERYPYCNVLGKICENCFDINHFEHKIPMKEICGKFIKKKCSNHCMKTPIYKAKSPKFTIILSKGNGDCLYECVENSFDHCITIDDLRTFVAYQQNEDTYSAYREINEHEIIKDAKNFHDFRHIMQRTGAEFGASGCMWGDENTLYYLSNEYLITFVIFNQKGNLLQKITPQTQVCKNRYITLHLNNQDVGREHYDLLVFDGNKILDEAMWQTLLKTVNI